MSENDIEKKEQVFFLFNNEKEDINTQIQKSFMAYLKDTIKIDKKRLKIWINSYIIFLAGDC